MTFIDDIITNSSKAIFSNLYETGELRILRILAERGTLNQKEIGELTNFGAWISFDRWGVKRRLEGKGTFLGLIPYEFIYGVKRNQKETQYELTLKGLLAILSEKKLEEVYLIKRYKRFLRQLNNDPKILRWAIDFIKSEIALILYHNYLKGFDWTKLMITRRYWHEFKQYDHDVIKNFFIDTTFLDEQNFTHYDIVKDQYLKNFFILDACTSPITLGQTRNWYEDELEFEESFRKYVDRWYMYIDVHKMSRRLLGPEINRKDVVPYYDEEFWYEERKYPQEQAEIELQKKGFKK